jgi:hypothetical protein
MLLGQAYAAVFDAHLKGNQRDEASRGVSVAATRHGRGSTTLVLTAPLEARPHLVRNMRAAAERAFGSDVDVDGQVDTNGDVLVRVTWHPRRPLSARLVEPADAGDAGALESAWPPTALVPALVLYDRQQLAINWRTLRNVLIAAPTGQGADVPLVALIASLCSKREPKDLGLVIVARPHTLPDEVGVLPHGLLDVMDPADPVAVQRALESVKVELDRRRQTNEDAGDADLVVVVRELCELEPEAQRLLGEIAAAGPRHRCQLVAASERPVAELLEHCSCVDQLGTRLVLETATEQDSVALLGMPGAETIGSGGYALLRLDGRLPVPRWAYRLPADRLAALVHLMGTRPRVVPESMQAAPPAEGEAVEAAEPVSEPAENSASADPLLDITAPEPELPGTTALEPDTGSASASGIRPTRRQGAPISSDPASLLAQLRAAPLRVRCFGTGEVWYGDRLLQMGNPELLLLFGVHPIRGINNEALAEMLWKKVPADINGALRTRRYDLRQELYRLVPELQGDPLPGTEYQGEKLLAVDPSIVASDVHEFTLLLTLAQTLEPAAAIQTYEAALRLYGGELLDGTTVLKYRWLYVVEPQVALTFRADFRARHREVRLRLAELLANGPEDGLARAEELYAGLCAEDLENEHLWIARLRINDLTGSAVGLERVVRSYRSAQVELGATDVEDIDRVPLPANLERMVKSIQQHIGVDGARSQSQAASD